MKSFPDVFFYLKKKFLLGGLLLIDSLEREFSVNPGSGEVRSKPAEGDLKRLFARVKQSPRGL
jgi:hypothetical protein